MAVDRLSGVVHTGRALCAMWLSTTRVGRLRIAFAIQLRWCVGQNQHVRSGGGSEAFLREESSGDLTIFQRVPDLMGSTCGRDRARGVC